MELGQLWDGTITRTISVLIDGIPFKIRFQSQSRPKSIQLSY